MSKVLFSIIHLTEIALFLLIGTVSFYPPTFVHQSKFLDKNGKKLAFMITSCYICRTPRINVNVTMKDITDALYLPPNTLLLGNLYEGGRCKAAMDKLRVKDIGDCFCMGQWWIVCFGLIAYIFSVLRFSDFLTTLKSRNIDFTLEDYDIQVRKWKGLTLVHVLAVCILTFRFDDFSKTMRYTLPGSVYDEQYFEFPSTWFLVFALCSIYASLASFYMVVTLIFKRKLLCRTMPSLSGRVIQPVVQQAVKPRAERMLFLRIDNAGVQQQPKTISPPLPFRSDSEKGEQSQKSPVSMLSLCSLSQDSSLESAVEIVAEKDVASGNDSVKKNDQNRLATKTN